MPVVISGGGAVATVADTPQIDLGLTNAQLTADVVAGSIDSTQLSSAVNSALTLAGTAVQPNNSVLTGVTQLNALRLNTYAAIVRTTAPATRTDGSALVAGDFWLNPNTGTIGFWRSPYWLTAQAYHTADRATAAGTADIATAPGLRYANPGAGAELVFVESCWVYRIPSGLDINSGDGSNYTTLKWGYHNVNTTGYTSIHEKNSNTIDNALRYRFDVNGAYTVTGFSMQRAIVGTVDIGTSVRMGVTYRVIL